MAVCDGGTGRRLNRRDALGIVGGAAAAAMLDGTVSAASRPRLPNFIVILADDLGYGDLGSYGARAIRTPHLDRMAREGLRMTDFYAGANVCTPSRAALQTGRYPIRTGLANEVIQPSDKRGLQPSEVTIAEALKPQYATALIGKWHLGHVAPFWPPTVQGYDLFFGLPYSHDMKPLGLFTSEPGVELTREDVDFQTLTQRFFQRATRYVDDNRDRPFFLMLALTAPHIPLNPNPPHVHSAAGNYGDVVEEVDAGVGTLLGRLKALGIDRDTFVIVTSDNGPWFEGSAGALRDRKGGAGWDGGYRVPFIVRKPGQVVAGRTSNAIAMNFDLLPTFCALAGKPPPADVALDGRDLSNVWARRAASPHDELVLFNNEKVAAIRTQQWKYVARAYYRGFEAPLAAFGSGLLFDVNGPGGENYDVAARHPDVLADMQARFKRAVATYEPMSTKRK